MRIFITGATGVLGKRVVPALVALGHDVTGVARRPAAMAQLQSQGARAVGVDLFDSRKVRDAIEDHDTIINLATHIPRTWRGFLPFAWKQNDRIRREASANLVAAGLSSGAERFIQESFAPAYPDMGDAWIDESTLIAPGRYNQSIVDAETSANRFTGGGRIGVTLRFGLFYGPNDEFSTTALSTIRRGWSPFLGAPSGYLAMVSQQDAASAVVSALSLPSDVYNVVDDAPVTRAELANELARAMSARPPRFLPKIVSKLAGSPGETISRSLRVSNDKVKRASNWAPSFANSIEGWKSLI